MKCQKCGTEHNSNFCPNCGTQATQQPSSNFRQTTNNNLKQVQQTKLTAKPKKKSGGRKALIIVISIFAFAATMGILFGEEEPDTVTSEQQIEQIEYIEISADELYGAFEANEVSADEKYKGKYVKVTGIVTEISSGGTFTQPCILLNVKDSVIFGDVQCNFSDDNAAKKIAEISKGQKITVTGLCSGLGSINLDINNCEIQ